MGPGFAGTIFYYISHSLMYDYIITGGGCAGLSLAFYMQHPSLRDKKILILDTEAKTHNDKTWCFWSVGNIPFLAAQHTKWDHIEFISDSHHTIQSILPLQYHYVNSLEFYNEVLNRIHQNPNISIIYEPVISLEDTSFGARVHTTYQTFESKWVFNSILPSYSQIADTTIFLKQHFLGWKIKTATPTFRRDIATLMDFRVPQEDEARFVYILPFSDDEALVEFTVFSPATWTKEKYHQYLNNYIKETLNINTFQILEEECGVIPMTNFPFPRQSGNHIIHIGTAGGFTKPTTGYTFKHIQEDTQQIVKSLIEKDHPIYPLKRRSRYKFYDNLLLYLIKHHPEKIKGIFSKLFCRNSITRILKFLAEEISIIQDLNLLVRLPWLPFFSAIWDYYIKNLLAGRRPESRRVAQSKEGMVTFNNISRSEAPSSTKAS